MTPFVMHLHAEAAADAPVVSSPVHQNYTTTGSTEYSTTITLPGGAAAGDALVAHFSIVAASTVSTPTNWTVLLDVMNGYRTDSMLFYRVLTSGDITAGTVAFETTLGTSRAVTFQAFRVTGIDTAKMTDNVAATHANVGTTLDATLAGCTVGSTVAAFFHARNEGWDGTNCGASITARGFTAKDGFYYPCGAQPATSLPQLWVGDIEVTEAGGVLSPLLTLDVANAKGLGMVELFAA